jgi:hypothetical protein
MIPHPKLIQPTFIPMSIDSKYQSRPSIRAFIDHRLHGLDNAPKRLSHGFHKLLKIHVNPCRPWFLFAFRIDLIRVRTLTFLLSCAAAVMSPIHAQDAPSAITKDTIAGLEKSLEAARDGSSEARQRLAVRRVIRDTEELVAAHPQDTSRFLALEFLFRARQQIIALDKDGKHRDELLETCRELVKAPDELADLRLEADLLLSQAELAKQGASNEARAQALRPFVGRYIDTPVGAKVLRLSMVMALELGDSRLRSYLQETIERRFAADLEMIKFQRDKLGGQVIGAPFAGAFERSDGKTARFPMDGLGRSTMLLFWTKNETGEALLKGIAAAALEKTEDLAGRLEFVSINLDDLPDAGESFVRSLGVDWKVLRLPGGKNHPIYDAFARSEQRIVTMSPLGYTALIMPETSKLKTQSDGAPDYGRMFQSSLAREWTEPRNVSQLGSLMIGDFLVIDPEGRIDPTRPPELKAAAMGGEVKPLTRDTACVPEETLRAIQDCFVPPPLRYRLSHTDIRTIYAKAAGLCRKAMADHPTAPDLWIVRNRLIIALMGLWKSDSDLGQLEAAITESKAAMTTGFPKGCDVTARLCIARGELRNAAANPKDILKRLVADCGGDAAPGPALAVASLLALDVADRSSFENFRANILKSHTEYPMMWIFTAFLLDRHHDYWLFQVPFAAGWSYDKRQDYFLTKGDAEEGHRILRAELQTDDGKSLRIPEDLEKEWTMIAFSQPAPWSRKRDDGLPESPERTLQLFTSFASARPAGDVKVLLATLGGDAAATRAALLAGKSKIDCPVFSIENGVKNPLVHRLGLLSEVDKINSVLIRKDGRIATVLSGLVRQSGQGGVTFGNVVMQEDEKTIAAMLERGEIQAAKDIILALAPPFDPNAVDVKGRKLPKPTYNLAHLRARARVYMALKEWDKALADAEEVVQRQQGTDGGMSLRTPELDESERLKDTIQAKLTERKVQR